MLKINGHRPRIPWIQPTTATGDLIPIIKKITLPQKRRSQELMKWLWIMLQLMKFILCWATNKEKINLLRVKNLWVVLQTVTKNGIERSNLIRSALYYAYLFLLCISIRQVSSLCTRYSFACFQIIILFKLLRCHWFFLLYLLKQSISNR